MGFMGGGDEGIEGGLGPGDIFGIWRGGGGEGFEGPERAVVVGDDHGAIRGDDIIFREERGIVGGAGIDPGGDLIDFVVA